MVTFLYRPRSLSTWSSIVLTSSTALGGLGGPAKPTYSHLRRPCSILDYQVRAKGWTVALMGSATATFWRLKEHFRSAFQAQSIPYLEQMTKPEPYGHWMLSTIHTAFPGLRIARLALRRRGTLASVAV